ncbi:MAG: sigma-70 family RNA polymerase sigma factor [Planctomycetes bacterium]|nr:sigma-70 family RNA polymerase sigma factor [Planctomycetota bacterium]
MTTILKKRGGHTPIPMDEAEFRRLWADGATTGEMATRFGCSDALISRRAGQLGLPRRGINTAELPQREILWAYTQHGWSIERITRELRPRFPTLAERTIGRLLRLLGATMRPVGGRRVDRIAECVRLVSAGMECRAAGKKLGLTRQQVERRVRKVLGPLPPGRKPRLPVRAIVSRALAGESQVAIAREFGCSPQAVSYHLRAARKKGKADEGNAA